MAKPTPPSLFSTFGFPTQYKVNPDFSINCSSSESLVSERAGMSMLNLCSSLVATAVLHSRRPDDSSSRRVLTFQQEIVTLHMFCYCLIELSLAAASQPAGVGSQCLMHLF